jgi:F-type H+-transporting ATPase subunit b
LDALGISLGYILAFVLSFGILFVVLRAWVFVPLLNQLEKRRVVISRGLEDARVAADARANAEKEANRIITAAQTRAGEVIREATERAQKVEQEIRAQAQSESAKTREAVMAELEGERNRMLSELRGQIVSLAIAAAQKLIEENLDERRQHVLVNEFFSGVRGGVVTVLEGVAADGRQVVEVTSALPLTPEEQETICADMMRKLGNGTAISFRVEPSILGGLVVRVGDRVVDGSVSGRLEDLRQNLRQ